MYNMQVMDPDDSIIMARLRSFVTANIKDIDYVFFFFQAEDGIRDIGVTGVQTCALPISEDLKPGDRVLALGKDTSDWGYSRIYATDHPGPIREHRFVLEAVNGHLPEHVDHVDENKPNTLPEDFAGVTNSKIVRHHVNGTIGEAERARLAGIAREGWGRNRDERLRSMERSEDSGRWLGLREWMEGVLWENAGKPTASRDIHGDCATAQE